MSDIKYSRASVGSKLCLVSEMHTLQCTLSFVEKKLVTYEVTNFDI